MAVTPEEERAIINKAKEEILLCLPEVMGNLMATHAAAHKINAEFYAKYPEFKDHKDVVQAVVESVEGDSLGLDHKSLLEKSVPEIRNRVGIKKSLSFDAPKALPRDFSKVDMSNGEL